MATGVMERRLRPTSAAEAAQSQADHPDAEVIAGGTLVIADRALGRSAPPSYLLLSGAADLHGVTHEADGVHAGAMATLAELHRAEPGPMLDIALRALGGPQIRNRGTLGGNIAGRRPAHTLLPCLIALGASVRLVGPSGARAVPVMDFVATGLGPADIVAGVRIPQGGDFQRFTRVARRNGPGYAIASVALSIDAAGRTVTTGLGGVGPTPLAAAAADGFLAAAVDWGARSMPAGTAEEYGRLLAENCQAVSDDNASADYRRHAVAVMGRRLVEDWTEEATHGH